MEQRITRAKGRIARSAVPYETRSEDGALYVDFESPPSAEDAPYRPSFDETEDR